MSNYEQQYLECFNKILSEGKWVYNERTGTRCLTIPRYIFEIDLKPDTCPLLSVRPSYPVSSIAEMVGYMRQYEWAQQFSDIGTRSWDVNSSQTSAWLDNPNRKGEGHIGKVYGAAVPTESIHKVWDTIQSGKDDRRCVINWWQPEKFPKGVLAPCLDRHNFTLMEDSVHLTSTQRSLDVGCGMNYNHISIYFLGMMAMHLGNKSSGDALHIANNVHIYESHLEGVEEMLSRTPKTFDTNFKVNDTINTWQDWILSDCHARDVFTLEGYKGVAHPKIDFELVA
ncbi:thymidylate synthase [Vibrio phage 1.121.O._10N.286.46.C4]|nr:thymidylate synthase [Vibrio phage 1.121.O._10N.286.46.C4]